MLTLGLIGVVGASLIALFSLGFIGLLLRRVVPTNMVHIVQTKKKTVSYGKDRPAGNVYWAWPSFLPMLGISVTKYPESVFNVGLRDYEAYDKGRLPFRVDIMAFFRISDSDVAAHRVSNFEELQSQLQSILQGAVRAVLGSVPLEEILQDRATLGTKFTEEVDAQLAEWGVKTVKSIEFMDIRDSHDSNVIENIMAKDKSRIERESRETVAENLRSAQEREIEAARQVKLQELDAQQQTGEREAQMKQQVGIAAEISQQQILEQAKVTAEKNMDVQKINDVKSAEIAREVAKVQAEQSKQVTIITAQAQKEQTVLIAEGKLIEAEREAKGIEVTGAAKAAAETALLKAPVEAQIQLAREIGANDGYQNFLIEQRRVEATEQIGKEMAGAMKAADIKVIANGGDVQSGMNNLMDLFTPKGGTSIAGMFEALSQTEQGRQVVDRLTGKKNTPSSTEQSVDTSTSE